MSRWPTKQEMKTLRSIERSNEFDRLTRKLFKEALNFVYESNNGIPPKLDLEEMETLFLRGCFSVIHLFKDGTLSLDEEKNLKLEKIKFLEILMRT